MLVDGEPTIRKGLVFHMRMQEGIRAWDIEPVS